MTKAPHQKDSLSGKLRNVLTRAAANIGNQFRYSANTADLNWDDEDYQSAKSEPERVYDPWNPDEAPQKAELRPEPSSSPSPPPDRPGGIPTGIHLEIGKPSTDAEVTLEVDESAPGPFMEGEVAHGSDLRFETDEDWALLEEAEEDLIEAKAEIEGSVGNLSSDEESGETGWSGNLTSAGADDGDRTAIAHDGSGPEDSPFLEDDWATDSGESEGLSNLGFDVPSDSGENEDLEIFDFDEDAHQSPWEQEEDLEEEVADLRASAKAASIVGLLDLRSIGERQEALVFLRSLFEHLTSPATFQALRRSAEEGLDLATLIDMVELRAIWMQRSEWWLMRYRGRLVQMRHGQSALSWPLARRVCLARSDHAVESMIDEEWLGEWLALPGGHPDFQYFTQFINEKVRHLDAENLHRGLRSQERNETSQELGNDFSWYRRIPDREGSIRLGFHFLTPYDERPGVIRPGIPIPSSDEE